MENQTDTPTLTIEERIATLENQMKILIEKHSKPRFYSAKILTDEEREAKRLKINEASRLSKLKGRAAAIGMTVEEYQTYQANKKAGLKPGWVDPGDVVPAISSEQILVIETETEILNSEHPIVQLESLVVESEIKSDSSPNKRQKKSKISSKYT